MKQIEMRNIIVKALSEFLGVPVIEHQPDAQKPPGDYVYYIIINPYLSFEMGAQVYTPIPSSDSRFTHDILHERIEQPNAVYRFVSVSGESDNAQRLCEQIQAFFLLEGELDLYLQGIVCVDATNPQDVTEYGIDSTHRMWSVDITYRYKRTDTRIDPNIEKVTFKQQ